MSKNIEKIVIVGGGSAGWMSAATLVSLFPEKEITVIESPNIPIVGVGESTIGGINNWTKMIGLTNRDFMPFTDASFKLSIKFTDFYKKGAGSFHYPFGMPNTENNINKKNDWYFKKMKYPETPVSDYADCMFPHQALVNENKIPPENHNIPGFVFNRDTAYHFDATKFGIWLRDQWSKPKGVNHIQSEVTDIKTNNDGIDYLILTDGTQVKADLFIDCTGFKSLLLGEALNEPFISYEELLPNNSAWATRVPYTNKKEQLNSYTECTAIDNGWVWNIPLWSRIGTGYVYSDKYASDEEALVQFKEYLKEKDLYREDLEYKNIKMRVGIHNRIWVKNVCAIGLSAGFIEPLESSGLFTVHEFLTKLARVLERGSISQFDKDCFTGSCKLQFRQFAEFVAMHYALSHRDDTKYWRDLGEKVWDTNLIEQKYTPYSGNIVLANQDRMTNHEYVSDFSGNHCIFTGMNFFPCDKHSVMSYSLMTEKDIDLYSTVVSNNLNTKKEHWKSLVKDYPTLYEYLKTNYYDTQD
jgi:tryptophan halogenase